jgi:hypothetical protein
VIVLPSRSVTRFFIPLIDVLILLFCIYLLLPIVRATDEGGSPSDRTLNQAERAELEELRRQALSVFATSRGNAVAALEGRLAVRVLEIDADTGKLFTYDPERHELDSERAVQDLIARQQRHAPGRELYYLLLLPHRLTGYPEERQVERYQQWLKGVAHGFDR